jgi:hypothetical protein
MPISSGGSPTPPGTSGVGPSVVAPSPPIGLPSPGWPAGASLVALLLPHAASAATIPIALLITTRINGLSSQVNCIVDGRSGFPYERSRRPPTGDKRRQLRRMQGSR